MLTQDTDANGAQNETLFNRLASLAWCDPARCTKFSPQAGKFDESADSEVLLRDVLSEMKSEALLESVKQICSFGERLSNASEEKAIAWLAGQYESAGLQTRILRYPARVSLPVSAKLVVDGVSVSCITHPMTGSADAMHAKLACVTTADIEELETRRSHGEKGLDELFSGTVVLIEGLATDAQIKRLCAFGAAGIIFAGGKYAHNMICSSQWGSPTASHNAALHQLPVVSICAEDARKIRARMHAKSQVIISTKVDTRWVQVPMVEARLEVMQAEDYILVTGHIDSWGVGALDNASGNATALEVARILSRRKEKLLHSLRFVTWSGHSHGRYAGSTAYCDNNFESLSKHCLLHLNADCLGAEGATLLTLSPAMACTARLAQEALFCVTGCEDWEGTRFSRSCDQSFWGAGVPSVFSQVSEQPPRDDPAARAFGSLFGSSRSGGYGIYWHTDHDTPEHLDPDNLVRDARVILAAAVFAATDEDARLDVEAEAMDLAASLAFRRQQIVKSASLACGPFVKELALHLTAELEHLICRLIDWTKGAETEKNRMPLLRSLVCANYHQGDYGEHPDVAPLKGAPNLSVLDKLEAVHEEEEVLLVLIEAQRNLNSLKARLNALELSESRNS